MIFGNAMRQVAIGLPTEGPTSKDELVGADAQGPPINSVGVSALSEDFWCHISHGPRDPCEETFLCVVNSNVEVGDVSMTALVQEDVVGFKVPDRCKAGCQRTSRGDRS